MGGTTTVDVVEDNNAPQKGQGSKLADKVRTWCAASYRAVLAEFLASSLLVFLGCSSCMAIPGIDIFPPMYAPFAFGIAVMLNIQAFGHISGAHMNPAVTVAAYLWGSISIPLALAYFVAQAGGSILGYYFLVLIAPTDVGADGVCMTLVRDDATVAQAYGMEVLLTSGLIFLCCGFWDPVNKLKTESLPIKFGLTVAGLSLAGAPLTGASLNPTRSLAPAIFSGNWANHWVYWVGPLTAGVVAPLLYKNLWLVKEDQKPQAETEPLKSP